jgi:uncharacterized membrane protein YcjF (UPF0283 family)
MICREMLEEKALISIMGLLIGILSVVVWLTASVFDWPKWVGVSMTAVTLIGIPWLAIRIIHENRRMRKINICSSCERYPADGDRDCEMCQAYEEHRSIY